MERVRIQFHGNSAGFNIDPEIDPLEGVSAVVALLAPPDEGEVIDFDWNGKRVRGVVNYYDEDERVFIVLPVKPDREPIFRRKCTNLAYSIMARDLNYAYLSRQEDEYFSVFGLPPPTRLEFALSGYMGLQFCFSGVVFTRHDASGNIDFSTGA